MALASSLQSIKNRLRNAKNSIGSSPGPLNDPPKTAVTNDLNGAQADIGAVLQEIGGVGTADTSNLPSTLPAIAAETVSLADLAYAEGTGDNPDNTYIGDKVKTINWMIDTVDGYKDLAGI